MPLAEGHPAATPSENVLYGGEQLHPQAYLPELECKGHFFSESGLFAGTFLKLCWWMHAQTCLTFCDTTDCHPPAYTQSHLNEIANVMLISHF